MSRKRLMRALHVVDELNTDDDSVMYHIHCRACNWRSRSDTVKKRTVMTMHNMDATCPKCGKHTVEQNPSCGD